MVYFTSIIGLYFFENDAGIDFTVDGACKKLMINEYLFQNLNGTY